MDDPQEYKSLDELFRKTFEELPERPAASGWDVPSPRVWEQVQATIVPPKSGWTTQSLLLLSGLAVVLLLGLYWALSRSPQPAADQPAVAVESKSAPIDTPASETAPADPVSTPQHTGAPMRPEVSAKPPIASPPAVRSPENTPNVSPGRPTGSIPLPGTALAPNTTIRRQMEELRTAPWAQPLKPLPSILKWKVKTPPPVPESLKRIHPADKKF
ncbi:MAG: hypothetical protein IPM98_09790 [Lewinellaceae bacterium]|nr:hypothetical protein [Lewinellaceae bacterium]